ncbi:hypothetical protein DPMN_072420 [Dreissena polymorpha]|uniref:Uncharacterized protein n=1 Tax=Dreissena polymorpha TaxID=45954 RepID=A0A9D4BWU8_DREPO|nr:hypothetical protein DPMN_072420 [Dreissena polymorpha]
MSHFVEEDFIMNRTLSRPCLLAVKILRTNEEDRARADFLKEIKIMVPTKGPQHHACSGRVYGGGATVYDSRVH